MTLDLKHILVCRETEWSLVFRWECIADEPRTWLLLLLLCVCVCLHVYVHWSKTARIFSSSFCTITWNQITHTHTNKKNRKKILSLLLLFFFLSRSDRIAPLNDVYNAYKSRMPNWTTHLKWIWHILSILSLLRLFNLSFFLSPYRAPSISFWINLCCPLWLWTNKPFSMCNRDSFSHSRRPYTHNQHTSSILMFTLHPRLHRQDRRRAPG